MKRFELGSGITATFHDNGKIEFTQHDVYMWLLHEDEARALCAALLECGLGPEEQVCRWDRNPPNKYNSGLE